MDIETFNIVINKRAYDVWSWAQTQVGKCHLSGENDCTVDKREALK